MFDAGDAPQAARTAADVQRVLDHLDYLATLDSTTHDSTTHDATPLDGTTHDATTQEGAVRSEAEHIDLIAALERLKAGAAAAQARLAASLSSVRAAREATAGVPTARRCRGLAAEIGLARRCSPHRGSRELGFARALVHEMPHTLALLTRGEINEWCATVLVRETAVLSVEDRGRVDAELAGDPTTGLVAMGPREAAAKARAIGYRLDPGSATRRTRGARTDRHVSLRPAPDTMTYLTGFLPVEQGVACYAALKRAADTARAEGDPRSRGQVMADTLVERLTGQTRAGDVDVEVQVVISDSTLLTDDPTPAHLTDHGPLHAALARQIIRDAPRAWLRRLYTHPRSNTGTSGGLVAMDSRRRTFTGQLRDFLIIRDQTCRTPWCDAPIRHADHITPVTEGGQTTAANGQGLCEACNYAKQAPDWHATPPPGNQSGDRHQVQITTPTGHTHTSTAPDPPRRPPPPPPPEDDNGDFVHLCSASATTAEELRLLLA